MQFTIFILLAILFVGQALLFFLFFRFFKHLNAKFNGVSGKNILKLLSDAMEKSESVENNLKQLLKETELDRKLLRTTLHKVGFIRFNPFKDMGGAHSFSIALLDADHNGFLITGLHGRDDVRIYAKEVKAGSPIQTLTSEEEKALKQAMK